MVLLWHILEEARTVEVDPQGRIVLPARIRERLGLKKGGRVSLRLEDSSRLIIEARASKSVEERVQNWVNIAMSTNAEIYSEKQTDTTGTDWKWMSLGYARRKLGLPTRRRNRRR